MANEGLDYVLREWHGESRIDRNEVVVCDIKLSLSFPVAALEEVSQQIRIVGLGRRRRQALVVCVARSHEIRHDGVNTGFLFVIERVAPAGRQRVI
jgi:hypothetical protein